MNRRTALIFYVLSVYVVVQFIWWGYHLIELTEEVIKPDALISKRVAMILGEGTVFLILLLFGIWQIRRSIRKELKLSERQNNFLLSVVDRGTQRIVFIGSSEGGVNIEEVAEKTPEKIIYEPIDPLTGPMPFQARKISKILGLNPEQSKEFSKMLPQLTDLFVTHDLTLLEINPLVITQGGKLHCLDAKINIDTNAI